MFSGNCRQSYWIQYTDIFGESIEFINDQWYHIFWSDRTNSYFIEGDQFIEEAEIVGLESLAELLKAQRTTGGKKHNGHKDLSTQGSSKHSVSSKTQGGNNSPISSSSEGPEELTKSLELRVGITPTPDKPYIAMSHAIAGTSTTVGSGRTGPFSTTGSIGGAPNWPASSGGHQIMQGSAGSQIGNTGFEQGTPIRQVMGPFGRPEPSSRNTLAVAQPAQPPVQQQQPQTPPAPQVAPVNPPAGQPPPAPQGQPTGPPGGQPPPEPPPGGPPGGLPQAAAPQQAARAPQGTNGAMKGQSPTIFDGN